MAYPEIMRVSVHAYFRTVVSHTIGSYTSADYRIRAPGFTVQGMDMEPTKSGPSRR